MKLRTRRPSDEIPTSSTADIAFLATYGAMVAVYDLLRQGREALGLRRDIQIALPTEREMAGFWL